MRTSIAFLCVIVLCTTSANAQGQPPYERVLVPVVITQPVAGAHGSQWMTELVMRNESDQAVDITIAPYSGCVASCQWTQPHTLLRLGFPAANPNAGIFLYVGSAGIGKVTFALRVQDTTRQANTWGTSVSVVRPKDVFSGKLQLLNIPVSDKFRAALRVYDFDTSIPDAAAVVRVRIYDMCGIGRFDNTVPFPCNDPPLVDTNLSLPPSGPEQSFTNPSYPGFAMVGDLMSAFPQLAGLAARPGDVTGIPRVRIDIDPITPALRFWAFASVTNNETQHVTVITPN